MTATLLHVGLVIAILAALAPRGAPTRDLLTRAGLGLRELHRLTADQRERTERALDALHGRR